MYVCSMCKDPQQGEPARVNASGSYCAKCNEEIIRRAVNGRRKHARKMKTNSFCVYCGNKLTEEDERKRKQSNTCNECSSSLLPKILECIRYSNKLYKHVCTREAKYKNMRGTVTSKKQSLEDKIDKILKAFDL